MFSFNAVNNQANATFGFSHVTGLASEATLSSVNVTSNVGTVTLNDGDVLPFDTVIQGNLSGNFDISNSSYTANIQGRYMFTITYTYVTGSNGGPAFTLNGQDILYCPTGITTGPLNSCFTYNVMPGDVIQVIHTGPPIIYNFLPLYSIFTVDLM